MGRFSTWLHAHVPSYMLTTFAWSVTAILLLGAVLYAPSFTTLFFVAAALLTSPSRPLRRLAHADGKTTYLPKALTGETTPIWLVLILSIAGAAFAPRSGDFTLYSYLDVQFARVQVSGPVEYESEPIDASSYLSCTSKYASLRPLRSLDARELGTHSIVVLLSEGSFERAVSVELDVRDTQAPVVTLAQYELHAKPGDTSSVLANIASVRDPVDGPLEMVSERPAAQGALVGLETFYDQGWYTVTGLPENDATGTYPITVEARDKHGNKTIGEFTLVVEGEA